MMKYLLVLLSCICLINTNAQEAVVLELRNESIDEFKFPIKINEVTASVKQKVGNVYIQELRKNYPLEFKEPVAESINNYLSFLQTGETYSDTINLHIKQLKIKERAKGNEEESVLDLAIEFYTGSGKTKEVMAVFSDEITVSDPNISVFHEYNVRLGLNQSLKWFLNQQISTVFQQKSSVNTKTNSNQFIQSTNNPHIFIVNNKLIYDFTTIEEMAAKQGDRKIKNLIFKRDIVKSIGTTFAGAGMLGGILGYAKYKSGEETQGSQIIVGSVVSFLLGAVIWSAGESQYKANLIQQYNKIMLDKQEIAYEPYNPVKIGFSIPLR